MKVTLDQLADIEYEFRTILCSKHDYQTKTKPVYLFWFPGRVMEYMVTCRDLVKEFDENEAQKALDFYNSL